MSEIQLRGFKELDKELAKLPLKIQKKTLAKVVREGAKVIQKDARRKAPKRTEGWGSVVKGKWSHPPGTGRRGIVVRKKKEANKSLLTMSVTLSPKAFYMQWVEFGHKLVRNGRTIGHIAAKPFLRPAFDNNKSRVLAKMKAIFLTELGKYKKG